MDTETRLPDSGLQTASRDWKAAMRRGLMSRCPACGTGAMFTSYLKVAPACPHCGEELHHHRADDAPPYFGVFIVGHVLVPLVLIVEKLWHPELWIHFSLWLPLAVILALLVLPPVKGAIVGMQWAMRMHGFDPASADHDLPPPAPPGHVGTGIGPS